GRNKYETYNVIITNLYNCVFIVKDIDMASSTKSFSYADIITKTIKIYE
ncbi:MAG: Veg family protein, partial [Floccifex sp.]